MKETADILLLAASFHTTLGFFLDHRNSSTRHNDTAPSEQTDVLLDPFFFEILEELHLIIALELNNQTNEEKSRNGIRMSMRRNDSYLKFKLIVFSVLNNYLIDSITMTRIRTNSFY